MDLRPVGRAEDVFALFARGEYAALGPPPHKGPFARHVLEPLGQALGLAVYAAVTVLPDAASLKVQDALYAAIQGGPPGSDQPFDPGQAPLAEASALAAEVERRTGTRPAFACLLAHAPVAKEWLHLNPLMFRHALKGLAVARGGACRPMLINAVDPFALDMLGAFQEGAYAGFMSRAHIGFLRVTEARPVPGRILTAGAGWDEVARRALSVLAGGGDLIMVLAGGVPATARAMYALREAVGRLCRESPSAPDPAGALARLAAAVPSFGGFRASGAVAETASAWRLAEAWVMSLAMTRSGRLALEAGRLDAPAQAAWAALAAALRTPPAEAAAARKTLEAELSRETPFRERLLRLVAGRISAKGRPVVLLPLTWGRLGAVKVAFGPPVALLPAPRGKVALLDASGALTETAPGAWERAFVEPRFD